MTRERLHTIKLLLSHEVRLSQVWADRLIEELAYATQEPILLPPRSLETE